MTSSQKDKNSAALLTQQWIEEVVIGLNLCPFAKPSWKKGQWEIFVSEHSEHIVLIDEGLAFIKDRLEQIENGPIENLFVVMPFCKDSFIPYLNLCSIIEMELDYLRILEKVQMVCFHPEFRFEGEDLDAPGNYVNRSPYPMIHILKKASMDKIVERFGAEIGEEVSFNNKETLESLSKNDFETKVKSFIKKANWP